MSNDTQNLSTDQMVDQFINQLVVDAGMNQNVEDDVLGQLKADLKERLENRINALLLSQIPENKLEEFEALIDEGDAAKTQAFCAANIPNLTELLASEFLNFKSRYIS